jgi:hypothetical protein
MQLIHLLGLAAGLASATACSSQDVARRVVASEAGTPPGLGTIDPDPLEASDAGLAARVSGLFNGRCGGGVESSCHLSGAAGTRLSLGAINDVVNVRSSERPEMFRVVPGAATASYLYLKVSAAPAIDGDPMPPGVYDPRISALVSAWIAAGAPSPAIVP